MNPDEVEDAFLELLSVAPQNDLCLKFSDYILNNYVLPAATFPPQLWCENPSSHPRTTNGAESFHRHFKDLFYSPKPCIHLVLENLRLLQTETYLKINSISRRRRANDISVIVNAHSKFLVDNDILAYLKRICYKCLPPTNF